MAQLDELARELELDPEEVARLPALPTLGAWRRAHGVDGWCELARVTFAHALAEEAQRRAIIDRLDGILIGLHRNADPRDIGRRLWRLALETDPSLACAGCEDCEEEAA